MFRTVTQWSAVWFRLAVVSTALKEWTWPQVLTHAMVIWRLCDESLATYGHPYLGLLYHEMVFNSWRQRALRRDPAFVLAEVVKKVDEQVMQSAKARLTTVLHGLGGPEPKESRVAPAEAAAGGQSELIAKQQAALSKLEAQMQAVQKRATPRAAGTAEARQCAVQAGELVWRRLDVATAVDPEEDRQDEGSGR
jgi:hypothetical protein